MVWLVDGVAYREPDPAALAVSCCGAAWVLTLPDEETAEAMRLMLRSTHSLTKPAEAIGLAALLREHRAARALGGRRAHRRQRGHADAGRHGAGRPGLRAGLGELMRCGHGLWQGGTSDR